MHIKIKQLEIKNNKVLYYNNLKIKRISKEVENFINDNPIFNTKEVAKQLLLQDLDYDLNNLIKDETLKDQKSYRNLINAYKYIFSGIEINESSLNKLYQILSKNLLDEYEINNMSEYYRNKDVYILNNKSHFLNDFNKGIESFKITEYMNNLLTFINENTSKNAIDEFIKSQIFHFYFVYIHPYFDVNGRTSRTAAMWYLLNKEVYPYLFFSRAITFSKDQYKKSILTSIKKGNITVFLEYILKSLLEELKKEKVIKEIEKTTSLSLIDKQVILCFLSLKKNKSIEELALLLNGYDLHKFLDKTIKEKIYPLILRNILQITNNNQLILNKDIFNKNTTYQKIKI